MLSGPRRAQAGSHLPKNRPDTRCGESRKRPTTGPCGELATHFMGLLVCAENTPQIAQMDADRNHLATDQHRFAPRRVAWASCPWGLVCCPLSVVRCQLSVKAFEGFLFGFDELACFGVFGVEAGEAGLVWSGLILVGGVFGFVFHAADAWGNDYIPPCNPPKSVEIAPPAAAH